MDATINKEIQTLIFYEIDLLSSKKFSEQRYHIIYPTCPTHLGKMEIQWAFIISLIKSKLYFNSQQIQISSLMKRKPSKGTKSDKSNKETPQTSQTSHLSSKRVDQITKKENSFSQLSSRAFGPIPPIRNNFIDWGPSPRNCRREIPPKKKDILKIISSISQRTTSSNHLHKIICYKSRIYPEKLTFRKEFFDLTKNPEVEYLEGILEDLNQKQRRFYKRSGQSDTNSQYHSQSSSTVSIKKCFYDNRQRINMISGIFIKGDEIGLSQKTLYLAVLLMDHYTAICPITSKTQVYSFATACLYISIKYNQIDQYLLKDLKLKNPNTQAIFQCQHKILKALNYQINQFIFSDYLTLFSEMYGINDKCYKHALHFANTIIFDRDLFSNTSPKLLALGLIAIVGQLIEKSLEEDFDMHSHTLSEINLVNQKIWVSYIANKKQMEQTFKLIRERRRSK